MDRTRQKQLAHGLNEELTIILNSAVLAAKMLGPEHPASDAIVALQESAFRCSELARKLSRHP